jgi:Family of unknown function (DUF6335)
MAKRTKKKARTRTSSSKRRTRKNTKGRKTPKTRLTAKRRPVRAKARRPKKRKKRATTVVHGKSPRLDRARRVLTDPVPASSLDVDRFKAAARSGRQALDRSLQEHSGMTPAMTGGDVDADWENAYFSGDEAPGGDNLTPDQENVEEMGEALGLSYEDNEELKGSDKVIERDKHRWELDPASADDYKRDTD